MVYKLKRITIDSNSRLVYYIVDEDDNGNFRFERVKLELCASFEYVISALINDFRYIWGQFSFSKWGGGLGAPSGSATMWELR